MANTHVPILKATCSCLWEGGILRPGSKSFVGQPGHNYGASATVTHAVEGMKQTVLGAKKSQSLTLGSWNCSPSNIPPPGGSSGSCLPPDTPVVLSRLPVASGPPLEQSEEVPFVSALFPGQHTLKHSFGGFSETLCFQKTPQLWRAQWAWPRIDEGTPLPSHDYGGGGEEQGGSIQTRGGR